LDPARNPVLLDEGLNAAGILTQWAGNIDSLGGPPLTQNQLTDKDQAAIAEAVAAVHNHQNLAAVVLLGDLETKQCGEWGDRDSLVLTGAQIPLLEAVLDAAAERNKVSRQTGGSNFTVTVVLVHGRPQTFGPGSDLPHGLLSRVDSLFAAWRPGLQFGNAMAKLLMGSISPSGKLAHSWPRSAGHIHSGAAPWLQPVVGKWLANKKGPQDPDGRRYNEYEASLYGSATPLFRFGFGLDYTTWKFTDFKVVPAESDSVLWQVRLQLHNTGKFAASQVVQVYVQDPVGLPFVPFWKRLVAFRKVFVPSLSSLPISIEVLREDVEQYSPGSPLQLNLYPGLYNVSVGSDSEFPLLFTEVEIRGNAASEIH